MISGYPFFWKPPYGFLLKKRGTPKFHGESVLIMFRKIDRVFGKSEFWTTPQNVVNQ